MSDTADRISAALETFKREMKELGLGVLITIYDAPSITEQPEEEGKDG